MEPVNLRGGDHTPERGRLYRSGSGSVVVKRLMGPHGVVVGDVATQELAQMGLAENHDDPGTRDGSSRWPSTTADRVVPPLIRITHPFHPLQGQGLRFVVSKQLWGEDRVTFEAPDGSLRSVPVGWTNAQPADPYLSIGGGRSRFRVEDLLQLAELVATRSER